MDANKPLLRLNQAHSVLRPLATAHRPTINDAGKTANIANISSVLELEAVFFDADGVLIDSLPEHLHFVADKATEFGLQLKIPTVAAFRRMVSNGAKVSPMVNFFSTVGFPRNLAERAASDYRDEFSARYVPHTFPAAQGALARLHEAGLKLGLVTSNTRKNVLLALGEAVRYFEPSCLFFLDSSAKPIPKWRYLAKGARRLVLDPLACAYVGDQPGDADAASRAGFRFVAVTYGWGITTRSSYAARVNDLHQLTKSLLDFRKGQRSNILPCIRL